MNNRFQILGELARRAGLGEKKDDGKYWIDAGYVDEHLDRFAKLIAAEERWAIAKLCEKLARSNEDDNVAGCLYACAKEIRYRLFDWIRP